MLTVGLLDAQSIQASIFAKQLRKAGYRVVFFITTKKSRSYFSRYANKKVLSPSSGIQIRVFHDFFLNYLDNNTLDVVVPLNDSSAKYLSQFKSELSKKVKFSIPDFPVFMKGFDKNQLMQVCAESNLPHPASLDLSKLKSGEKIHRFKFPAIIKPNESSGAKGFKIVKDFKEVWANYGAIAEKYGNCHLQEFIPHHGRQYKVEILIKDSKVVYSTVLEKRRFYPITGGSSCFNVSIVNDHLVKICTKVLNIIGWEGFADFDLIEDPRDGIIKIMEINPRSPNCLKASVISGIDFPNAIVNLSLGRPLPEYTYQPGRYLRYFAIDLLWLLTAKNKLKAFGQWRLYLFSSRHFLEDGDLRDPLPFFIGSFLGLLKLFRSRS